MTNRQNHTGLKVIACLLGLAALIASPLSGASNHKSDSESKNEKASAVVEKTQKISPDLRDEEYRAKSSDESISVILQFKGPVSEALTALLSRSGVKVTNQFSKLNTIAVDLPASVINELAYFDEVSYASPDSEIKVLGHINNTTGADLVRAQSNASGSSYTLNGTGIGIAVVDSGMFSGHKAFSKPTGSGGRITFSKDFTGENRVDDPFGHGTHVATAAAGYRVTGTSGNRFEGVAWNANLINLRVLNSHGTGTTSGLLSALDWILANRAAYNIRVVNLSLGTPAISSYQNDPLCQAVRRLANAGIVVVAAAGNDGKNISGQKQYGAVHSPGNEPSAITVGSTNTFGTDTRSDDIVTTYSSRGPTRSYTTDTLGVKHYDNLVKPDLVAPGNKLIFAESDGNLIVSTYPNLDAGAAKNNYRFMYMSGSSMSTPLASGAAALLLQANPNLTPNMVKMILMYTAQQLPNFNMFEQGAGQLNIEGAIRLAKAVRTDLNSTTALGSPMLNGAAPTPQSTVAGTTFPWAQGIVMDHTYARGANLITLYQKIYNLGVLVSDGTVLTNGVLVSDTTKMTNGVALGNNIMTSNGVLIGDGVNFFSVGLLLGNGVLVADGVLVGDGVLISDGLLLSNGVLIGDNISPQSVLVNGDNTACMY
jgi:serine protease AprX